MRHVPSIDATGLQSLEELLASCRRGHVTLILSAVGPQPLEAMRQSGFLERLGTGNFAKDVYEALDIARRGISAPGGQS
jgi:SulP family sulfate permease